MTLTPHSQFTNASPLHLGEQMKRGVPEPLTNVARPSHGASSELANKKLLESLTTASSDVVPKKGKRSAWEKFVLITPLWGLIGGLLLLGNTVFPHGRLLKAMPELAKKYATPAMLDTHGTATKALKHQFSQSGQSVLGLSFIPRYINGIAMGLVSAQPSMILANVMQFVVTPLIMTAKNESQKIFATTVDMFLGGLFTLGFANEIENKISSQNPNATVSHHSYDMTLLKGLFNPKLRETIPGADKAYNEFGWIETLGREVGGLIGFTIADNLRVLKSVIWTPAVKGLKAIRDGNVSFKISPEKLRAAGETTKMIVKTILLDPPLAFIRQTRQDIQRFSGYLSDPAVQGNKPTSLWERMKVAHQEVKQHNANETSTFAKSQLSKLPTWLTAPSATMSRVAALCWYAGGIPIILLTKRNPNIGKNPLIIGLKIVGGILANLQLFTLALARTDVAGKAPMLGVPLSIGGMALGKGDLSIGLGYAGEAANNLFFSDMALNGLDKSAKAAQEINAQR